MIHKDFLQGDFVAKLTERKTSAIPTDQALESKYNKQAKSASGVIGISRRNGAVCNWNLIKHEKLNYTKMLRDISGIDIEDEYSLHHELSQQRTTTNLKCIQHLFTYVVKRGNPFDVKETAIKSLVTGATFDNETSSFLLNYLTEGPTAYDKSRHERLDTKSAQLLIP